MVRVHWIPVKNVRKVTNWITSLFLGQFRIEGITRRRCGSDCSMKWLVSLLLPVRRRSSLVIHSMPWPDSDCEPFPSGMEPYLPWIKCVDWSSCAATAVDGSGGGVASSNWQLWNSEWHGLEFTVQWPDRQSVSESGVVFFVLIKSLRNLLVLQHFCISLLKRKAPMARHVDKSCSSRYIEIAIWMYLWLRENGKP